MNDHAIIELYFARDERAVKETADRYGNLCMQVAMNILNNRADAEECVNDTYVKVWNAIPPQQPASLRAFVCRITRNLSINRLRDLRREKRNRDLELSMEELADCITVPEERSTDLARVLSDFLQSLGETDRILFMGRYWHACSVKEMAQRMAMTENYASVRLHRIRERLRVYLSERGYRYE